MVEADMTVAAEVVSIIRHEVRPGSTQAYEDWIRDIVPIGQHADGHRGVTVMRPPEGTSVYTVVLHFDTAEHLRGWLESDVRRALLARIEPHLVNAGEVEVRPGLEFWLPPPHQKRPRPERQFLVALSVIYPLAMLVPLALAPMFASLPALGHPLLRSLLVSIAIVGLMTYVVMPRYTRLVAGWLYGK